MTHPGIRLNDVFADKCCVPDCSKRPDEGAPLPICRKHMLQIFDHLDGFGQLAAQVVAKRIPFAVDDVLAKVAEVGDKRRETARVETRNSQVYYVATGDLIKIGYSGNIKQRMNAMRLDLDAVLATEPGGVELERMRHRQFAADRVGQREDFQRSDALLSHVAMILEHYGPPKITTWGGKVAA